MVILSSLLLAIISQEIRESRQVGVWVMTMFDQKDKFGHWADIGRRKGAMPIGGPFSCSDPAEVEREYAAIRKAGINYVVLDDTNTTQVDDGLIDKSVKAWFDYSDRQPADQRLQIAIAAGGELNQHSSPKFWHEAVDFLFKTYATRPSYMKVHGKPVLYWYIEVDTEPNWIDTRWSIRKTFHFFRTADQFRNGGWGYGGDDTTRPEGLDCASIQPGWDLSLPGFPRNGGLTYCNRWVKALQSNAKSILLSDWNGWNEGTALSESNEWKDNYGDATPTWYMQLTSGYVQLSRGHLMEGSYYRLDGAPDVYKYTKGKFEYQGEYPHRTAVIVIPPGYIKGFPPIR